MRLLLSEARCLGRGLNIGSGWREEDPALRRDQN